MAGIITDVGSDIQRLQELRKEIDKVKQSLGSIEVHVDIDIKKDLEAKLSSLKSQYDALLPKVVEVENKITQSAANIKTATEAITEAQKKIVEGAKVKADTSGSKMQENALKGEAKAYLDLKDDIDSILGTREQNIRQMIAEQNAIRLINAEIKQINNSRQYGGQLSRTQSQRLQVLNDDLLTHKQALSEVRAELANNSKLDIAAAGSMNELSQSLSRMRIAYRELNEEERNSPFGKNLLASIQQADAKIKEMDAAIGNHQRNVGNYQGSFNGLNMSVQQIVRELPSATMGLNMFFLAISNNLPIMADQIKYAKEANAAMKAAGQEPVPVWKQLVTSIFSWQTAMMVGITLLTIYGKDIANWAKKLFTAKTATDELVFAQQQLRDASKEAQHEAVSEQVKLKTLYATTQDTTSSMKDRISAVNELKRQYPSYFGKLSTETILVGKASGAYRQLAADILKAAQARALEKRIEKLTDQNIDLERANNADNNWQRRNRKSYEMSVKSHQATDNGGARAFVPTGVDMSGGQRNGDLEIEWSKREERLQQHTNALKRNNMAIDAMVKQVAKIKGTEIELDNQSSQNVKTPKKNKETGNKDNSVENLFEERQRIHLENDRTAKDMAFETEQATIDALKDSSEKTLRQLDLNKRKELDKIDRDYEDLRQKRIEDAKKLWDADTNNKDNNFYDSESYKTAASDGQYTDAEKANRAAKIAKANADYIKGTKEVEKTSLDAMTAYLKEYGSMQEKRLAIAKEYDEKIALAQTDGEHLTLQAQKAKALADFDINSQKQSMNWENVFGNLDMFTKSQLENIKSQLRDMLSSNDMDLEGYKTAVDQIDRVNDAILVAEDKHKSFLGVSITYGETRRKLEMDVADAMQRQADLQGQLGSAQAGMNLNRFALWQTLQNAGISYNQRGITTANRGDILQKVGDKYGVDSSKYKEVQAALDKLSQSERDYNNVLQKKSKADQDAQGKQSKLNKYLDDFAAKLADLMPLFAQINDNIQDIPGLLSTLGVSEDSSLGKGAAALADGANSTMSAMQDYLSGNYVGAAMNGIKAIGSYVQSATNLFAGAGNEKAMEAEIERLSKANESLSTAINNLAEKISDSDNTNEQSVEAYKQAKKDEEEWEANQRKAINDRASEYTNSGHGFLGMGGKGSFNKHAKGSGWSGWYDFNAVLENIGSTARVRNIQDFWKLSPEDMKELQTSANAAWRALFDNDGYKSPEDLVNEYIERAGKLDELTDSLNEKITGYSWDSFKDGYLSMLEDLESSTADFADDINEKINNAILSALVNSEFKDKIEAIYKEISDAAADDNLTEDEINSIKQKNEKIASDMLKRRSDYEKMGLITTSTSSQTATTNSVSNITNDQATELIGRMTAIQIGVERGNTQRESIVSSIMLASNGISSLQVIQASSRDIADETRTMIANIYLEMRELNGHQENIEKAVLDMQGRVRKIEVNTQDL